MHFQVVSRIALLWGMDLIWAEYNWTLRTPGMLVWVHRAELFVSLFPHGCFIFNGQD